MDQIEGYMAQTKANHWLSHGNVKSGLRARHQGLTKLITAMSDSTQRQISFARSLILLSIQLPAVRKWSKIKMKTYRQTSEAVSTRLRAVRKISGTDKRRKHPSNARKSIQKFHPAHDHLALPSSRQVSWASSRASPEVGRDTAKLLKSLPASQNIHADSVQIRFSLFFRLRTLGYCNPSGKTKTENTLQDPFFKRKHNSLTQSRYSKSWIESKFKFVLLKQTDGRWTTSNESLFYLSWANRPVSRSARIDWSFSLPTPYQIQRLFVSNSWMNGWRSLPYEPYERVGCCSKISESVYRALLPRRISKLSRYNSTCEIESGLQIILVEQTDGTWAT
jgi:hypothetical protein